MSIFTCGICKSDYDPLNKTPLSLPCGHVFCKECIKEIIINSGNIMKCPKDNKTYQLKLENIPICVQILNNLPKKKDNSQKKYELVCSRHPKKKIEFFCKTHLVFPCSICIVEHNNHSVVCFKQNEKGFDDEISKIKKMLEDEKEKFLHQKIKYDQAINQINEYFTEEIKKVNELFEEINAYINKKKQEAIFRLKSIQSQKISNFDEIKKINVQVIDKFIELNNSIMYIKNELYPKGKYEKFYHIKTKILNELKTLNLEEKNANFGEIIFNNKLENYPIFSAPKNLEIPNHIFGEIKCGKDIVLSNLVTKDLKPYKRNYSNCKIKENSNTFENKKSINIEENINTISNEYKESASSLLLGIEPSNIFQENLLSESNNPTEKEESLNSPSKKYSKTSPKNKKHSMLSFPAKIQTSRETGRINITGSTKFSTYTRNPFFIEINEQSNSASSNKHGQLSSQLYKNISPFTPSNNDNFNICDQNQSLNKPTSTLPNKNKHFMAQSEKTQVKMVMNSSSKSSKKSSNQKHKN